MIRRPPRSTQSRSSAASDVYKRQVYGLAVAAPMLLLMPGSVAIADGFGLSLIHISEPTRTKANLVCRLLLEKKKKKTQITRTTPRETNTYTKPTQGNQQN